MTSTEPAEWQAYLTTGNDGQPMLVNKVGALNVYDLAAHEYREVMKRTRELRDGTIQIPQTGDLAHWQAIHAHQFGAVYEWAGQLRTADMAKDGVAFLAYGELESYLGEHIPTVADLDWQNMDREVFVEAAAWSFSALNVAHPFREGNGRSLRLFLDQLSESASWRIDYAQLSGFEGAEQWDAACHATRMTGPDIDPAPLEALFDRIVEVKDVPVVGQAATMPRAQRRVLGMARIRPAAAQSDALADYQATAEPPGPALGRDPEMDSF